MEVGTGGHGEVVGTGGHGSSITLDQTVCE